MYPHYHNFVWRRGPSRILWFGLGAFATTMWHRRSSVPDENHWRYCRRPPLPSASVVPEPAPVAAPGPLLMNKSRDVEQWEAEREHLTRVSKQATDAMTELTEATLDKVLATAEILKSKLAEHKAQREQEEERLAKRLEDERRNPSRYV